MGVFDSVKATREEHRSSRAGDAIVAEPNVVMDRAFTVPAAPEQVWPWLVQLGKKRAGWYLPASIEKVLPPSRRALRRIDLAWQHLAEGDVIPDYGGRHATFQVAELEPGRAIVYTSCRGQIQLTWSIVLRPMMADAQHCRVLLRLRMAQVRHRRLATTLGELLDALTIAGLAAGLRERVGGTSPG